MALLLNLIFTLSSTLSTTASSFDGLHEAVHAADGDHAVSLADAFQHLLRVFLLLVLRTDDEEVEDDDDQPEGDQHGDELRSAASAGAWR